MELGAYWDYEGLDPVRVQVQLRGISAEELRVHLANSGREIQRSTQTGSRYFLIIDARAGMRAPPDVRKLQAEWLAENSAALQATCVGIAFVIKERIVRGALTAVFWMTKSPVPYTVHSDLQAAFDHAKQACLDDGLSLPRAAFVDPVATLEAALAQALHDAEDVAG